MATERGPDVPGVSSRGTYRRGGHDGAAAGTGHTRAEPSQLWDDARATVRAVADEKQRSTATDIAQFARALRDASRSIPEGGPVGVMAAHSADTLERFSETLRNKDLDGLLREVQDFARSQPAMFLGMAVAAGFLATRFLRSSASQGTAPAGTQPADHSVMPQARGDPNAPVSNPVTEGGSFSPQDPRRA